MAITMKELAYMAGVSRATVDRVLNKRGRVNPDTKERVSALAEKMGYQPNLAAKSLAKRNRNYKIGCVINRIDIFEDVITGIKAAAKECSPFGISTIIKETKPFSVQRQLDLIDELTEEYINALVIAPVNDAKVADKLNSLIKKGIEVVAITADIAGVNYLAFVGCNHIRAGRAAADLIALMTRGPANIALVAGSLKMLGHNQRIQGFKNVIQEKYPHLKLIRILENQDDDIISYNIVSGLLKKHRDVDVLFFVAGGTMGGIRAVEELGLIPKIKIVTFDLTENNRNYLSRGIISTILCQEPYEQGYQAIKILNEWLLSGLRPQTTHIYTKTEIIVRELLF